MGYKEILQAMAPEKYPKIDPVDPYRQKYDFEFIGPVKPPEPIPINKPTTAEILEFEEAEILFYNVNSIRSATRQQRVSMGIQRRKPEVAIFAETKHHKKDPEFKLDGYYLVTQIARDGGAGGMMVYAKDTINIEEQHAKSVVKEVQVVDFMFAGHLVIGVYRSPNAVGPPINQHKKLIQYIKKLLNKRAPGTPFSIVGDFNLPTLAACNFRPIPKLYDYTCIFDEDKESINMEWSELFAHFDLTNHVTEPSRPATDNRLDLLITEKSQGVPYVKVDSKDEDFMGLSDHYPLYFKIDVEFATEETIRTKRVMSPNNLEKLREYVKMRKLEKYCPVKTGESMINHIQSELKRAFNETCPIIECKPPPARGWLKKGTVHYMRQCNRIRYQLKNKAYSDETYENIKATLKKLKKYTKFMCKRDRTMNDIRKFEVSAKKKKNFYQHVKGTNAKSSKIGPILDLNGNIKSTKKDMTESFGANLKSELTPDLTFEELQELQATCMAFKNLPECQLETSAIPYPDWTGNKEFPDWFNPHPDSPDQLLTHCQTYISIKMVKDQIKKSNRGAAAGPDDIPMLVYSVTADLIAPMLSMAFNLINQSGRVPQTFKETKVRMLYKKKDKRNMNNYRPLSLTNHIGKLWERCINSFLIQHLEDHKLLSDFQDGFRPKRGTFTGLTKFWELVTSKVEKHRSLVEVYNYDLTKAFDRLNHSKVLHLLHKAGIGGKLGACIQDWLTTRTQFVEMGIHKSPEAEVMMSCIQGSVLGPTLWTLYINSLLVRLEKSKVKVDFFAYADDLTIVKHLNTPKELSEFNDTMEILLQWAREFNMTWSPAKTQRLVLKHRGAREPHPPLDIYFGGNKVLPLETRTLKTKCVSLGVSISKDMVFTDQRHRIATDIKAKKEFVIRFFSNLTEELLIRFYWAYIFPTISYCSVVWNPMAEKYLRGIDKSVESFWKLNRKKGPRGGQPSGFLCPSLHLILIDMIFVHRLLIGESSIDFDRLFKICDSNTRQGTSQKLVLPDWDLQFSKHKLTYRAVRSFNELPLEARKMSRNQFKNFAKAHILENMDKYIALTLEFNVVGKIKAAADPVLMEKIKELKRISHTRALTGWNNSNVNSPINRAGTSKFWIPTMTPKRLPSRLRLQMGTPSRVPCDLVNLQGAENQNHNLRDQLPGCMAKKCIPRALSRLF